MAPEESVVTARVIGEGLVVWLRVTPEVLARRSRAMARPVAVSVAMELATLAVIWPWLLIVLRLPL